MQKSFELFVILISFAIIGCEERESIPSSYKGLEVTVRQSNYDKAIPMVNYHQYLYDLSPAKRDQANVDYVIIQYENKLLTVNSQMKAIRFGPDWLGSWELLKVVHQINGKIALMDCRKKYMSLDTDNTVKFSEDSIDANNLFKLVSLEDEKFAIQGPNQAYLSSEDAIKPIKVDRSKVEDWETFTIFKVVPPDER